MKYKLEWFDLKTEQSMGVFEHETYDFTQVPNCPRCGKPTEYNSGQVGEDIMGNAEYAEWFDCYKCHVQSEGINV